MTPQIFLHHYPASLFSEKIRVLLGYLDLPWHSVEISSTMPRPLLMPLSGGYRKTPTLQIGANVYCDTAVIAAGLARHSGNQSLFQEGFVANRVAEWADSTLFRTTVALNFRPEAIGAFMGQLSEEEVARFQADRAELAGDAPIVSLPPSAAIATFASLLTQLESSLGADFLFGDTPSIADFSVYHCLWFVQNNPVNASMITPFAAVSAWLERMRAFGHGAQEDSDAELALAHAKQCDPVAPELGESRALGDVLPAIGTKVSVTPTDYGQIPVAGVLVAAGADELVIKRNDPQAGDLMNHFPVIGFDTQSSD